ncbi:MAG: Bax inhibitor-1 family protein [Phycisphaeraceae bacterium]
MTQSTGAVWPSDQIVAESSIDARGDFIRKTYLHLAGAIGAFIVLQVAIFQFVDVEAITMTLLGGPYSWLIVLGAFMAVSWLARYWAESSTSLGVQYAGLGLYVVAQAVIFVPILYIASDFYPEANIITTAALTTIAIFAGLTLVVFVSGADFSFLRGALAIGGIAAMALIVLSIVIGFELGLIFTVAMIALASGYILYDTSNIIHHYRIGQHVAASLALFASVALLFWYVLRLVMAMQRN